MKKMIISLIFLFISFSISHSKVPFENIRQKPFSETNLKLYILSLNIKFGDIVFKQAVLETGHFKSNIFLKYNNLFGMHFPFVRETAASGYIIADGGKIATYKHWTESVDDYFLWQKFYEKTINTNNCYYAFLEKAGYAMNKNYIKILKTL